MAEGILSDKAKKAGLHWIIDSAGTNGYHIGEAPHPLSQATAWKHGIDISKQRCRKFIGQDFDRFDIVYAMAEEVITDMKRITGKQYQPAKVELLMNVWAPGKNIDIPDPWSEPAAAYEAVYEMIDKACSKLIEQNS